MWADCTLMCEPGSPHPAEKMRLTLPLTQKAPLWGPGHLRKGLPQIWFSSQRQSEEAGNAFPGRLPMRQPSVINPKKTKSLWFQCQPQGHTCYCFFNLVCLRLPDRAHCHCLLNHSMQRQEFLREECLSRERKEKFKACEHIFLP